MRALVAAFWRKQLIEIRRNPAALRAVVVAVAALITLTLISPGATGKAAPMQVLYLPPVVLVGILVSDSIDSEVRALLLLRAILPSTSAFLAAKWFVLVIQIVPLTAVVALGSSAVILGGGVRTVLVRTLFASGEALLLCALAIGLAASFTSVEEVPDHLTINGKLWILTGYWFVAPIAAGALWCLDVALLGAAQWQLWFLTAMVLAAVVVAFTAFLTVHGLRRLGSVE